MKIIRNILILCAVALFSACTNFDFQKTEKSEKSAPQKIDKSTDIAVSTIRSENRKWSQEVPQKSTEKALEALRQNTDFVLYFSYDNAEVDPQSTAEIIKHANFMKTYPELKLRLEGHADERGTREYNLALGENRALAVRDILNLYGLAGRIFVISFGEEKPVSTRHDESGWRQNRRVEFIYQ